MSEGVSTDSIGIQDMPNTSSLEDIFYPDFYSPSSSSFLSPRQQPTHDPDCTSHRPYLIKWVPRKDLQTGHSNPLTIIQSQSPNGLQSPQRYLERRVPMAKPKAKSEMTKPDNSCIDLTRNIRGSPLSTTTLYVGNSSTK